MAGGQLGECVQVTAVAFGIGAAVEASAAVFTVVKLAGAAYLVFLGVQAIRHRRGLAQALGQPGEPCAAGWPARPGGWPPSAGPAGWP